jgi:hypothetical protein
VRIGWVAFAVLALLLVAKLGQMHWHADAAGASGDALPFKATQEGARTMQGGTRSLWKPILL